MNLTPDQTNTVISALQLMQVGAANALHAIQQQLAEREAREEAEHNLRRQQLESEQARLEAAVAQAVEDTWIEWHGGDRPLPFGSLADIKFRDGEIFKKSSIDGLRWTHNGSGSDVVAYRPA